MKKALTAIHPYRKAIVGALLAGGAVVLADIDGTINWKTVAKAVLASLATGGGVYQTTNAPKQ